MLSHEGFSQQLTWNAGLFSFFDNTEFGKSKVKIPQTMAGVMLIPEAGLTWDTIHEVNFGVNLMHEFGSSKPVDKFYTTAYYCYDSNPFRFIMGAFPRNMAVARG
jgi:preprotein translocase subunit Sec61beta